MFWTCQGALRNTVKLPEEKSKTEKHRFLPPAVWASSSSLTTTSTAWLSVRSWNRSPTLIVSPARSWLTSSTRQQLRCVSSLRFLLGLPPWEVLWNPQALSRVTSRHSSRQFPTTSTQFSACFLFFIFPGPIVTSVRWKKQKKTLSLSQ